MRALSAAHQDFAWTFVQLHRPAHNVAETVRVERASDLLIFVLLFEPCSDCSGVPLCLVEVLGTLLGQDGL